MPVARRSLIWLLFYAPLVSPWALSASTLRAGDRPVEVGSRFAAQDTLDCGEETLADARQCLDGLAWKPAKFEVRCEQPQGGLNQFLVRFPSPIDTGDAVNDQVAMEWYPARASDGSLLRAPAMVVVHESGRKMPVGRAIAVTLQTHKMHAFMIQLPGYGARESSPATENAKPFVTLRQAIADVQRARDAVAAIPCVDSSNICLQGTSLGGFVTATVAGLDHGYQRTFILLAGGNLHQVILEGELDAAATRKKLTAAGIDGEKVRELTWPIEPLRLAHRINPATTWLYSGAHDNVVPPACSHALAKAAKLPPSHHIVLPVTHYSGIVLLPKIVSEIYQAAIGSPADQQ